MPDLTGRGTTAGWARSFLDALLIYWRHPWLGALMLVGIALLLWGYR